MESDKESNWLLPLINVLVRQLRLSSYGADHALEVANQKPRHMIEVRSREITNPAGDAMKRQEERERRMRVRVECTASPRVARRRVIDAEWFACCGVVNSCVSGVCQV